MPTMRDIRELHPQAQGPTGELLRRCAAKGRALLVYETRRTFEVQKAYFARGRRPLTEVNLLYAAAGLGLVTAAQNQTTITNAEPGRSWHNYGLAIDFAPLVGTVPDWIYSPADAADLWDEIAAEANALGFIWGKSFGDLPHLEYHPGWTDVDDALSWANEHAGEWRLPLVA